MRLRTLSCNPPMCCHATQVSGTQFGVKIANVSEASLCRSTGTGDASVGFQFEHQEAGRIMHGTNATGQASMLSCPRLLVF